MSQAPRRMIHGAWPIRWAVPLLATLYLLAGCRKPEEGIGLGILDPTEALGIHIDTTTLVAWTAKEPSLRTSGLSRNALGSYVDMRYGTTKAGIATQLRLSTNNVGFGQDNSGLVLDSIVLALLFDLGDPFYGDLSAQRFQVFEIQEDLSLDTVYRTDRMPVVGGGDLVRDRGALVTPRPFTKPVVGGDTAQPQLRLRLDDALGRRFLDAFGTADLTDNAAFLIFFKGLDITVDNPAQAPFQGGLLFFNLLLANSKVTLHYRNTLVDPAAPLRYDLVINDNCVRWTHVQRDYAQAADPVVAAALADTTLGRSHTFVQALGGLRTKVQPLGLGDLPALGYRALAKAELVVPVEGTNFVLHPPPQKLFVFRANDEGEDLLLPDELTAGISIGGNFNSAAREYRFNITRYVQGVLTGTFPDRPLSLVPVSSGVSGNTVMLAGPEAERPMRLLLTFTTY